MDCQRFVKRCIISTQQKIISIILARGGSKGIPRKNILNFAGLPLIAWTIIQSKLTKEIDETYLSSDSDEILEIASNYGAKIIKRPSEIAQDESVSEDAILHALDLIGSNIKMIVMLEPTSPLRKPQDISNAIKIFKKNNWDSGFSGAKLVDFLIWKKNLIDQHTSINYDYKNRGRRQNRESNYVETGAIYIFKPSIVLKHNNRLGGYIGIFPCNLWQSFEIDEPDDWNIVEILFNKFLFSEYDKYKNI